MTVARGLWKLTWLEIKIFLREPLGVIGTLLFPVLIFIVLGKLGGGRRRRQDRAGLRRARPADPSRRS